MTSDELRKKLQEKRGDAAYLQELFESLLGFTPKEAQFMIWLNRFDLEVCSEAIERTGEWHLINQQILAEGCITIKGKTVKLAPAQLKEYEKSESDIQIGRASCRERV